mmetsp:Transcript_122314/g.228538  ORF Transcript_122314/g.228538 Transcript_122314/m.228538 type:complete len:277 (-) Transcript_122314:60-890(-)
MYADYNKGLPGAYGGATMLKRTVTKFKKYKELYPSLLTMALFAVFGSPMITGYRMYDDPNVKYWVGESTGILLCIPVFLVLGHIIQAFYGRPMFFPLLFMIVPPALLCLFVGYSLFVQVSGITTSLLSNDCVTFVQKWEVQNAYENALGIYNDCADIKATAGNTTAEAVKKAGLVLTDCKNYKPEGSKFEKQWGYLQALEARENCAGWCYNGEVSLWQNNHPSNDACSSAAAAALGSRINNGAQRMMLNGLMGFLVGGSAIMLINEWIMEQEDGKW